MESYELIDWLRLFAIPLLVVANAFFVAAEFSLVSVRKTRISELAAHDVPQASAVEKAIENPNKVIATTQLGSTLSSLGLGWLSEPALAPLIAPLVELFPLPAQPAVSQSISVALVFLLITFLHVVVGQMIPKSIALQDPEGTSLSTAGPVLLAERILRPALWVLTGAGNALLKLFGVHPSPGSRSIHSEEELKMLVSASAAIGAVEADESEMLHAVIDFSSLVVRQVMIPRTEMLAVEAGTPFFDMIHMVNQSTYTKFPVYEENLDQITGIVHVKDLVGAIEKPDAQQYTARDFAREAIFVPETITGNALLRIFRDKRQHIAIVMDEFGGIAGLVTLEDLMEEIVGEVSDPFDAFNPEFQQQPDGTIMIDGLTLIDEVNEELGLSLADPNYDTIAGFVMGRLGRIPRLGDEVESEQIHLRVEEMDGLRIARLTLTLREENTEGQAMSSLNGKGESS